jgi:hypothetical protein
MSGDRLLEALAALQLDVEREFNMSINAKHAPLLIPRVAIDPGSSEFSIVTTAFANLNLPNTATTSSTTQQLALDYTGRGVLQFVVVAECTSGGAGAFETTVALSIDGVVIYGSVNFTTTQNRMRVLVGRANKESTALIYGLDDPIGIPFNSSCQIAFCTTTGSVGTTSIGWRIAKKL